MECVQPLRQPRCRRLSTCLAIQITWLGIFLVFPALKDGFDQTHACYRVGLNGINISPDSTRLWVNDLWMGRLWVFDRRPDGRCVTLVASTVTRNLKIHIRLDCRTQLMFESVPSSSQVSQHIHLVSFVLLFVVFMTTCQSGQGLARHLPARSYRQHRARPRLRRPDDGNVLQQGSQQLHWRRHRAAH